LRTHTDPAGGSFVTRVRPKDVVRDSPSGALMSFGVATSQ
jgi:hypothetical protein